MKIIERYLSAYVIDCLFGHTNEVHMDYVYQVLRESGSKTDHPILSKVLDYVRQGDPKDPHIKDEVRAYVLAMAQMGKTFGPMSDIKAKFSTKEGYTVFVIYDSKAVLGMGLAKAEDTGKAIEQLQEQYPGIQITQT
jgi:hypothetical protein